MLLSMQENKTKIIATIGPQSKDSRTLLKMTQAGMDGARLNFSHGSHGDFSRMIKNIRKVGLKLKKHIAIIQDLSGAKLRFFGLPEAGVFLKKGEIVNLAKLSPVFKKIRKILKKGNQILIDDGKIELRIIGKEKAKVIIGGLVKNRKGINLPNAKLTLPSLAKKDIRDIKFGIKNNVAYICLSFAKSAEDIKHLQKILKNTGIKIIAKIECRQAILNLEEIIKASDAVMVARGDLGLEIPPEMVPIYQKKIIHLANIYGKPVIVATQMLASMIDNPRPTRAEVQDTATAIFEHADSLLLSNETTIGKYPVEAVKTLTKVASAIEKEMAHHPYLLVRHEENLSMTDATCLSAAKLALDIKAKYIIAITKTGYTALEIAKYRPSTSIIVFTENPDVANQLSIVFGVKHTFLRKINLKNAVKTVKNLLLQKGLIKKGDEIVICNAGFKKKEKFLTSVLV